MVFYAFVWEKRKTMNFSESIVVYDLKLATDDRSDKKFLLTSKLCPFEAVCPLPRGYIHVLNPEQKNVLNHTWKRILWNLQQMGKVIIGLSVDIKLLHPEGCLPLSRGYIQVLNHDKKSYKIRFQRDFFKLAKNDRSDKVFLLT